MDNRAQPTTRTTIYALWHIPSSTLLITTADREEAHRRLDRAVADGIAVEDLMLQVTDKGELIGRQHLGARIQDALRDLLTGPDVAFEGV